MSQLFTCSLFHVKNKTMSKERKSLTAVYLYLHTGVLWLKFLDRLDKPVQLGQTHDLGVTERYEKERNEDRQQRLSTPSVVSCSSSVPFMYILLRVYVYDTIIWLYMHVYTTYGGREFLSQIKSLSISPGMSVSMCVNRVGLLICKNTLRSAPTKQLALGLWLVWVYKNIYKSEYWPFKIFDIYSNFKNSKFNLFRFFFFFNQEPPFLLKQPPSKIL